MSDLFRRLSACVVVSLTTFAFASPAAAEVVASMTAEGAAITMTASSPSTGSESRTILLSDSAVDISGSGPNAFSWMASSDTIDWNSVGTLDEVSFELGLYSGPFAAGEVMTFDISWDPALYHTPFLLLKSLAWPVSNPSPVVDLPGPGRDDGFAFKVTIGDLANAGGSFTWAVSVAKHVPAPGAAVLFTAGLVTVALRHGGPRRRGS